jgi:outer membrane immunogenic protein
MRHIFLDEPYFFYLQSWGASMRHFIFSAGIAAGVIVSSGAAGAADLAPRPYIKAPPIVAAVYDWTGFYVGANLGWSFGRARTDVTVAGAPFASTSKGMDGILGGLQAGYNWQSGPAVFGLETDIQATAQKGSSRLFGFIPGRPDISAIPCTQFDPPAPACIPNTGSPAIPGTPSVTSVVSYQNKLPWFGTLRGRLGFAPAERWLIYATGGLAYGEVTTNETLNVNGAIASLITNRTRVGWTIGAGVEAALWSNWTAKLEYLYIDFGTINNTLIGIAPITPIVTSSRVNDQIVRVGLNYRFGQSVVARY